MICTSFKIFWGSGQFGETKSKYLNHGKDTQNVIESVRDTQKVIQCVQLHISHQMKPYSIVKAIWGSSYTCFSVFQALGQVRRTGPKYTKSWAQIHRNSSQLLNSTFHIKWSLGVSYTCFSELGGIGGSLEN